jgi:hypothetical protein
MFLENKSFENRRHSQDPKIGHEQMTPKVTFNPPTPAAVSAAA